MYVQVNQNKKTQLRSKCVSQTMETQHLCNRLFQFSVSGELYVTQSQAFLEAVAIKLMPLYWFVSSTILWWIFVTLIKHDGVNHVDNGKLYIAFSYITKRIKFTVRLLIFLTRWGRVTHIWVTYEVSVPYVNQWWLFSMDLLEHYMCPYRQPYWNFAGKPYLCRNFSGFYRVR